MTVFYCQVTSDSVMTYYYDMDYQRITLRIPVPLHNKLMDSSKKSSKSMNAEIIARLEESYNKSTPPDADLIRSIIKEELAKQLKQS